MLASLDKAFSKLGFVHADMRISNVMEHHLDAEPIYPKGFTSRKQRKKAVGMLTEPKSNTFTIPGQSRAPLFLIRPLSSVLPILLFVLIAVCSGNVTACFSSGK